MMPEFLADHWFAGVLLLAALGIGALHALLFRSQSPLYCPAHRVGVITAVCLLAIGEIALLIWGGFGVFNVFHNFLLMVGASTWALAALIGAGVVLIPQLAQERLLSLPLILAAGLGL